MFDKPPLAPRRAMPSLALLLVAAATAGAAARGPDPGPGVRPEKPHPTRKVFDMTPPHPGEMLANLAKGSGSPPQLKEFAPTAAIHLSQEEAGDAKSDAAETQAAQGDAKSGKSNTGARPAAVGPAVLPSDLQKQLGEQIAQLGIEGFLSRSSQAASPQEQQSWGAVRRDIATSMATWQALYAASPTPKDAAPVASSAPETGVKKP